ncbi:TPA: tail fiber protein [Yersinia enterocolitica]|nr:tail fiber protein [Yersinia enterocolitica]
MASMLAQFIADNSEQDVLDDGKIAELQIKLESAIKSYTNSNLPLASTNRKGIAQLSSLTNSSSEALAATSKAVKTVSDATLKITSNFAEIAAAGPEAIAAAIANLGLTDTAAIATNALQKNQNLSDVADKTAARTNLGLKGAAVLDVGSIANTVAAGNDSRIVNAVQSTNTAITLPGSLTTAGTVTGGGISSIGAVYAGNTAAWLAADGNVYGSVWGGYLSTYLSNRGVRAWAAVRGSGEIISGFGFAAINRTNVGGYNFVMSTSNGDYAVTVGINGGTQNGALNAHSANIWNRTPNSFSIQNARDGGVSYDWTDWPEFYVIVVGP